MGLSLKRKRSFNALSSPTSTSSQLSISPNGLHPQSHNFQINASSGDYPVSENSPLGYSPPESYMVNGMLLSESEIVPSHLPSRTRKRFRNNRPDETSIHTHTLNLLFSAQQSSQPHRSGIEQFPNPSSKSTVPTSIDCDHGMLTPSPTPAHSRLPSEPFLLSPPSQRRTSSSSLPTSSTLAMEPEPGQKTLHSFFPSDPTTSTPKRPSSAHAQSTSSMFPPSIGASAAMGAAAAAAASADGSDDAMDLEPSSAQLQSDNYKTTQQPLSGNFKTIHFQTNLNTGVTATATAAIASTKSSAQVNKNNKNNPFTCSPPPPPPSHPFAAPHSANNITTRPLAAISNFRSTSAQAMNMDLNLDVSMDDIMALDLSDSCPHLQVGGGGGPAVFWGSVNGPEGWGGMGDDGSACTMCGKSVCDLCAVRGRGPRRCLECGSLAREMPMGGVEVEVGDMD